MKLRSTAKLAGFALRSASLGSRFIFVLFAAVHMTAIDFGIYGLVASATALILQIVGLELYQITLRSVARSDTALDTDRAHYGRFMLLAALMAALSGGAFAAWFGWSPYIMLLAAGVCATEYIGTETQRICVVEDRADLAMFSVSIRYLPWNLGMPLAALAGIMPSNWWTIEFVLEGWLACSVIGSAFLLIVGAPYFAKRMAGFRSWFVRLSPQIPRWIVIALCYRFLETGMRLVPGILINEQAAGRLVLLSTLASIGSTGLKAALEPFWFVRLIRQDSGAAARREFMLVTIGWLAAAAIASTAALIIMQAMHRITLSETDWISFALLVVGSSFLSMSQIPHFALYAADRDRTIQNISIMILGISVVSTVLGTLFLGMPGTALGVAVGAGALFIAKASASAKLHNSLSTKNVAPV